MSHHINPAFHADLFVHYSDLLQRPDVQNNPTCKQLLQSQLEYHQDQYCRLMELTELAGEFKMPVKDLLHLAKLVQQNMDADENITLDMDDRRICVKDENGCVIAWNRTNQFPTLKTA